MSLHGGLRSGLSSQVVNNGLKESPDVHSCKRYECPADISVGCKIIVHAYTCR